MDFVGIKKQISTEERAQINRQVKEELIEHLYQGCLPGTISGVPVGVAVFLDFYGYTSTPLLVLWSVFYLSGLTALTVLYFAYMRYKHFFEIHSWLMIYAALMCFCALLWGISVFLIPDNLTRQYFAFIALFLITTGYAMGSIGVFELCVATLTIILAPFIMWCFMKGTFFYYLVGFYSLIYIGFMAGINRRSTQWFKDSLILKLENNLVSYQANHDILTNLPNQRLFPQFVEAAIRDAVEFSNTFSILCFSLNRMEMINDSLGHQASDAIVHSISVRLKNLFLQTETPRNKMRSLLTVSRTNTFNIIVTPLNKEKIDAYVAMLFSVLNEPFYLETRSIKMTASVGASFYPDDGKDMKTLLSNAEAAMLKAKQFGGNHLELYRTEINAQQPERLALENDLHLALKQKEFKLFYQPFIDLHTGRISGMEALIRWFHPQHGIVSPLQFIPIAEETGMIIPIGEWVLEEACVQNLMWHQMGFNKLRVAVNLASKQLREQRIVDVIKNTLLKTGLKSEFLELEITETSILDETVIPRLKLFKEMGLSLSVDDFGTGYSGLSYLKRFSIDKLKIDQSFIRDIPANTNSITIVSAILAMGKELHIKTLAEGVETKEQADFLRTKECDFVQGYLYSKPLPPEEFTQLLIKMRDLTHYSKIE